MSQQQLTEKQIEYIAGLFDYCKMKDLKKLKTPEELHLFANYHTREGGEFAYRWIIEHPKCDKGTALLVYWRAEPIYYYENYAKKKEVPEHELDVYETIKEIEKRIKSGFYKNHNFKCNEEYRIKKFDATKLKQIIPKEMFEFDKGEIWEDPLEIEEG